MKGRTNEEGIDPATDKPTDNARRRGHRAKDELRLYVRGWPNYYKLSNTFSEVKDLSQ